MKVTIEIQIHDSDVDWGIAGSLNCRFFETEKSETEKFERKSSLEHGQTENLCVQMHKNR